MGMAHNPLFGDPQRPETFHTIDDTVAVGNVRRALADIDSHVAELGHQIARLREAIEPILGPSYPEDDSPSEAMPSDPSDLATHIIDQAERLRSLTATVVRIVNRVDL